jgi:hypothetical protein
MTKRKTASKKKNHNKNINKKVAKGNVNTKEPKKWHAVPLKSSFMLTAILGLLISAYWVYPQSKSYGFTFIVVFGAMLIAALVSMSKAPLRLEV